MGTPYGSKEQFNLTPIAGIDIGTTGADYLTLVIPSGWEGELSTRDSYLHCTETVAADQTNGTVLIRHTPSGGTIATVGTYTSTDADAANAVFGFTEASGYEHIGGVKLSAGDTVTVSATAATDSGSVAGTFTGYLAMRLKRTA